MPTAAADPPFDHLHRIFKRAIMVGTRTDTRTDTTPCFNSPPASTVGAVIPCPVSHTCHLFSTRGAAMHEAISFGQWLRQRRRSLDLTQEELARRIGCSDIAIRKMECGMRRPSRQVAE